MPVRASRQSSMWCFSSLYIIMAWNMSLLCCSLPRILRFSRAFDVGIHVQMQVPSGQSMNLGKLTFEKRDIGQPTTQPGVTNNNRISRITSDTIASALESSKCRKGAIEHLGRSRLFCVRVGVGAGSNSTSGDILRPRMPSTTIK